MSDRDWNDPQYKAARLAAFKRDKFKCRFPSCSSNKGLNAHHIRKWADHPEARFEVSNLFSLCRFHHNQVVNGNEDEYVSLFCSILSDSNLVFEMISMRFRPKPD